MEKGQLLEGVRGRYMMDGGSVGEAVMWASADVFIQSALNWIIQSNQKEISPCKCQSNPHWVTWWLYLRQQIRMPIYGYTDTDTRIQIRIRFKRAFLWLSCWLRARLEANWILRDSPASSRAKSPGMGMDSDSDSDSEWARAGRKQKAKTHPFSW